MRSVATRGLPVWEINTDYGFPPGLDDVEPGAMLLHYSLFGSGNYQLDERFLAWLRARPNALKVAFFQDEFYFCRQRFAFVNEPRSTSSSRTSARSTSPRSGAATRPARGRSSTSPAMSTTDARRRAPLCTADARREIDVGYRGRPLPPHMGAGSQEKRVIGERFKELAAGTGLRLDIETSEESRIYGDDWYRFLGRSRATLGVESGVSFMDLEDECHAEYVRCARRGASRR